MDTISYYYSEWLNFWELSLSKSDPRTKGWLLMSSPWPTLQLTGLYLFIVYAGMRVMKHREAYSLKVVLGVYNLAMVLLNFYIFKELLIATTKAGYSYQCQRVTYDPSDENELRVAKALWWFYFSKVLEFLDTICFVLRKKNNQVSFLHVYHHATMFPIWWMGIKWAAGGQSFFGALMNSFVHVLMYTYYGLAGFGPQMQKYLWWKRYLTTIQLIQFVIGIIHSVQSLYFDCDFPKWMQWSLCFYAVTILSLFLNFYFHAYIKAPKKKAQANGHHANGHSNGHAKSE